MMVFNPPGKDCGACGAPTCREFSLLCSAGKKKDHDCIFYSSGESGLSAADAVVHDRLDVTGKPYDFIISALPGEVSARKIILPFRPDLVERYDIRPGDLVTGRPMGQGCPVQHVLKVIEARTVSGVLTCHSVGPLASRHSKDRCLDIEAYHVIGFLGLVTGITNPPALGQRQRFLPSFCMLQLGHTGVVNMLVDSKDGLLIRVEDIRIL
jgi:uncharacterized Fe-S cluster-containing protein